MPTSSINRLAAAAVLTLAASMLSACEKAAPPAPPPPEVSFITVAPRTVEDNLEFTGQVQAYRTVQVRAQASGVIMARPFAEGSEVRAGDVLYRIDPTTTSAALLSAQARLAEAQARLSNAQTVAGRLRPLLQGNAVAKQDVDNAESQVAQARASVQDARGGVDAARKGLSETTVRAEIGGRVGRALLDVGARVTGSSDVLTTIDVLDPIYVSFRPSGQQLLAWKMDPRSRSLIQAGSPLAVQVTLPDGSLLPRTGHLNFVAPSLDAATGTQEFRAQFANPDRILVPGQFVRVRLTGFVHDSALTVPQRSVQQALGRQFVYVVGKGDTAAARDVQPGQWTGSRWIIEKGLAPGDRVIVDGAQKVAPGHPVRPIPFVDSTASAAVPAPGAPQ